MPVLFGVLAVLDDGTAEIGRPGLQSILSDAGVVQRPIADWFHIAMRLQHAKSAANALSIDKPR